MDGMDGADIPPPPPPPPQPPQPPPSLPPPLPARAIGGGRADLPLDAATDGLGGYPGDEAGGAEASVVAVSETRREASSAQDKHSGKTGGGRSASSTKGR